MTRIVIYLTNQDFLFFINEILFVAAEMKGAIMYIVDTEWILLFNMQLKWYVCCWKSKMCHTSYCIFSVD